MPSVLDLAHLVIGERKARDVCSADKVCISIVSDHERVMVDDGSSPEPLNHEVLVVTSAIVPDCHFNDSLLDKEHLVSHLVFLAHKRALFVRVPFHGVNKLLLRRQRQVTEVVDLVHFNVDEDANFVLILEDLLLEKWLEVFEIFLQFGKVRLLEHGQCAVILRLNSCRSLAIKYETNLAEMIPIN